MSQKIQRHVLIQRKSVRLAKQRQQDPTVYRREMLKQLFYDAIDHLDQPFNPQPIDYELAPNLPSVDGIIRESYTDDGEIYVLELMFEVVQK